MSCPWPNLPFRPGKEAALFFSLLLVLVTPKPRLRALLKQSSWYSPPSAQCLYVEGPSFMFVEWVTDPTVWHTWKWVQSVERTYQQHKTSERAKARPQESWLSALLSHTPTTLSVHGKFGKAFMHLQILLNSVLCLIPKRNFFESTGGRVSFGKSYVGVMRQQGKIDKQFWVVFCWRRPQKQNKTL